MEIVIEKENGWEAIINAEVQWENGREVQAMYANDK